MSYYTRMNTTLASLKNLKTTSFRVIRDTSTSTLIEYTKRMNGNESIVAKVLHTQNKEILLSVELHSIL